MRPHPSLYVDFFAPDAPRRLQKRLVLASTDAEFAFSVRWRLTTEHRCPKVSYMAKKLHRTLFTAVFHLAVCRAHSANRLNAAICALRHSRSLELSHLAKGMFPRILETRFPNIEYVLL